MNFEFVNTRTYLCGILFERVDTYNATTVMSVTDFPRISLIRDFSNLLFGYKRIIYERRQDTSNRSGATETKSIAHFLVLVHVHVTVIREVRTQSRQMKPSIRVGRWLFFKNVQQ